MPQTLSDYISKNFTVDQLVLGAILAKNGLAINTKGLKLEIAKKISSLDSSNLECRVAVAAGDADTLDFLSHSYDWLTIFNSLSSLKSLNLFQICVWRSGLLQWLVNFTCRTDNVQIKTKSQLKDLMVALIAIAAGHKFWI